MDLQLSKRQIQKVDLLINTGDEITYNITVTNTSKEDKKNVMIRDMVPELTEYVSGGTLKTISGKSYVTFLVDTLKAGESKTESFKVKVTGTGLATNQKRSTGKNI